MITDGSFVCGLCGEWLTGCGLCGKAPMVSMLEAQRKEREDNLAAERELDQQSRAIRREAETRRGEKW